MRMLVVTAAVLLGFLAGAAYVLHTRETLEPYTDMGAYVLKPGTVLSEQYQNPGSVVGHIDRPGVWIIK